MEKSLYSREYRLFLEMLRAVRQQAGLTQEDVATKLRMTQSLVSKCERGERRLDIVELRAWCLAIGMPFEEFILRFEAACRHQDAL